MSLVIKIKGTSFANSGLPKLVQTIEGFPVDQLHGLYLFNDANNGDAVDGYFADSSGNGHDGKLVSGWNKPIQQKSGIVTSGDNGVWIDSGKPAKESFSAVLVVRNTSPANQSGSKYLSVLAPVQAGANGQVSGAGGFLFLSSREPSRCKWRAFSDVPSVDSGDLVAPPADQVSVIAITLDASTGAFMIKSLDSKVFLSGKTERVERIASLTSNLAIGASKYGVSAGSVPVSAEIHLAAIYDSVLSSNKLDEIMLIAKKTVESRGVAVV